MIGLAVSAALAIGKALFGFAEKRTDAAVENARIQSGVDIETLRTEAAFASYARDVHVAAMAQRCFWYPWLTATMMLSVYFAWGVADAMLFGGTLLPDVAELPAHIAPYADVAWANLFYSGAGVAGVSILSRALTRR